MIPPLDPGITASPKAGDHAPNSKLGEAAGQFEALLIGQMLRTMRESGGQGWLGSGDDAASGSAMELAEEQFAQALASNGGLGLANLVRKGLSTDQAKENASVLGSAQARPRILDRR